MHADSVTFTENPIPMYRCLCLCLSLAVSLSLCLSPFLLFLSGRSIICMHSSLIRHRDVQPLYGVDLLTTFPSTLFSKRVNCVQSFRPSQRPFVNEIDKGRILRQPWLELPLAFFYARYKPLNAVLNIFQKSTCSSPQLLPALHSLHSLTGRAARSGQGPRWGRQ